MKNSSIFSEFTQDLYLYYMMLKQIPVTVCHNSGWAHNQKSKWQSLEYRKITKFRNQSFSFHNFMKSSPILFKFSQELYYTMLKQIPVTVCHKSGRVHNQKSKWLPFEYRKTTFSNLKIHHFHSKLHEK